MKRKLYFVFIATIFVFVFTIAVLSHPGKTDGSGGHYNHSTGEYHYHHGYPAHQHLNGVCPYSYDDNTDHGNSSAGGTTAPKINKPRTTKYSIPYDAGITDNSDVDRVDKDGWFAKLPVALQFLISLGIIISPFLLSLLYGLFVRCKEWIINIRHQKE